MKLATHMETNIVTKSQPTQSGILDPTINHFICGIVVNLERMTKLSTKMLQATFFSFLFFTLAKPISILFNIFPFFRLIWLKQFLI